MRTVCSASLAMFLALGGMSYAQGSVSGATTVVVPDTNVGFPVDWTTPPACPATPIAKTTCGSSFYTSSYALLWSDEFNSLNIAQIGHGVATWYTGLHAPLVSGEKVAYAGDPAYSISGGILNLKTRWSAATQGAYVEAALTSYDGAGHGYLPPNFYAEVRMKGPQDNDNHSGVWFTSIDNGATDSTGGHAEVDMAEQYGPSDQYDHSSSHIWPGRTGGAHIWVSTLYARPEGKAIAWHTYGLLATPSQFVVFRDGQAVRMIARQPKQLGGMYMLLSLCGNPPAGTPIPTTMQVDYVRVYVPRS